MSFWLNAARMQGFYSLAYGHLQTVKGELFAIESSPIDIELLLKELADSEGNFLTRYNVGSKAYIQIENFNKHQNPHHRETESVIPAAFTVQPQTSPGLMPTQAISSPENEGSSRADSLNLIPDSLTPNPSECREQIKDDECQRLADEGMLYLASLNSPNHSNIAWVKGYLGIQFKELELTRPELNKTAILSQWRDTCDLAIAKNATAPKWLKTTFTNKVGALNAESFKNRPPEPASGQAESLLSFPFIRHIVTGELFPSTAFEFRPETKGVLHHKEQSSFFPMAHLEGLREAPAHV
jgi:hypothetical protein